jgi:hypothetical protein
LEISRRPELSDVQYEHFENEVAAAETGVDSQGVVGGWEALGGLDQSDG